MTVIDRQRFNLLYNVHNYTEYKKQLNLPLIAHASQMQTFLFFVGLGLGQVSNRSGLFNETSLLNIVGTASALNYGFIYFAQTN